MKYTTAILAASVGLASAGPVPQLTAREVPQEHSHNFILDLVRTSLNTNNPKKIQDPVFGLLGSAAAVVGAGSVTNVDCLQQETADQAFTNAKAAGDLPGMAGALLFRAIERNTGKVGLASVICNETATNPEIAAVSQHQDPASSGAAATNKAITLALAKQLAGIGADPLLALETGTFKAGSTSDSTGKGNTCDTEKDQPGCIFTQNLIVLDATEAEISAAVAGISATVTGTGVLSATAINLAKASAGSGSGSVAASSAVAASTTAAKAASSAVISSAGISSAAGATGTCAAVTSTVTCSVVTTTVASGASTLATATAAATTAATAAASGTNVQAFTGTLGGAAPPVESGSGDRPFTVKGNTFANLAAAIQRSCDVQRNACFNAANGGTLSGGTAQCDTQATSCVAANSAATKAKRATNFGSCSDPSVVFKAGLDGRSTEAFIANNQADFNHGSVQNIGILAGFICQRLGSSCKAPADVQASCTSASAAAVATTQNQTAADAFNNILVGGGAGGGAVATSVAASSKATASTKTAASTKATKAVSTKAAVATNAPAAAAVADGATVLTVTQCS